MKRDVLPYTPCPNCHKPHVAALWLSEPSSEEAKQIAFYSFVEYMNLLSAERWISFN